jgi:hypothetical protein|tara:strand:+ start:983 stop:1123 length:141 start_codon:yes stop_codon:yes gene_type:complete
VYIDESATAWELVTSEFVALLKGPLEAELVTFVYENAIVATDCVMG